jgi:subtilisin family serine protease
MARHDAKQAPLALKVKEQVKDIEKELSGNGVTIGIVTAGAGVGYMFAEGQLLVTEQHLRRVISLLKQPDDTPRTERVERVIDDVMLVKLTEATATDKKLKIEADKQPKVDDALAAIDSEIGDGIAAPNYVLTVANGTGPVVGPCPATEPEEVYDGIEPFPGICTGNSGAGVLIYIADTGLLENAEKDIPWLHGVRPALDANGNPQPPETLGAPGPHGLRPIGRYKGHGTFVAGVARCIAPQADVIVSNVFRRAGSALESDFVRELTQALTQGVDIFNLSITSPTRSNRPMLAFGRWRRLLADYKGVVCVVAAGNSGVRTPNWPAAFPELVSVGALTADWRDRAEFSNYGSWVDVYAPGRNLINAFAKGIYTCSDEPYRKEKRKFHGMAMWSGTSFSTPIVTGLIADRMSRTGENGKEAAAALLSQARAQAIPGVGAVLLPCRGTGPCTPARPTGYHPRPHEHLDTGQCDDTPSI